MLCLDVDNGGRVLLKSLLLLLLARDDHDLGLYVTDLFLQSTQLGRL